MKLLKKLLPAVTIASAAAVVAPLVTSCGGASITHNFKDGVYTPKITPATAQQFQNADKATEFYFDEISKNGTILADDNMYGNIIIFLMILTEDEFQATYKVGGINKAEKRISATFTFKSKVDNKDSTKVIEIKDVIHIASYDVGVMSLMPNTTKLAQDDKWSIKMIENGVEGAKYNKDSFDPDEIELFSFTSNYLSLCSIATN